MRFDDNGPPMKHACEIVLSVFVVVPSFVVVSFLFASLYTLKHPSSPTLGSVCFVERIISIQEV